MDKYFDNKGHYVYDFTFIDGPGWWVYVQADTHTELFHLIELDEGSEPQILKTSNNIFDILKYAETIKW